MRCIPKDILPLYANSSKPFIRKSLRTRDISLAEIRRNEINAKTEELREYYRRTGEDLREIANSKEAVKAAQQLGFTYRDNQSLTQASDEELLKRLETVRQIAPGPAQEQAALVRKKGPVSYLGILHKE